MRFEIGEIARVYNHNIDIGIVVGVEARYGNDATNIYDLEDYRFDYDYMVAFMRNGELVTEWFSEDLLTY